MAGELGMRLRWTAAIVSVPRLRIRVRPVLLAVTIGIGGCQTAPAPAPAPVLEPTSYNGIGYIFINAPIAPQSRDLFIKNVDKLRAAGAKEIDVGINSPGGVIQSAEDIVDYMSRLHRDDGVVFKAYNVGVVASAATYVFLNAQNRYSSPRGAFLFHAAGLVSNGMITSERLRESADRLDAYERKISATLVSRTHLTESEAQTYVHRTVVLNADDARRDGVIDGIADLQLPKGVSAYVIASRPNRPTVRAAGPVPEQQR